LAAAPEVLADLERHQLAKRTQLVEEDFLLNPLPQVQR
jgi:hypothetical protein